jgi:hypothetical protein
MLTLTCVNDNLLLTRKLCGIVVDKSIFEGKNVIDEIVEINHFRVESLNDGVLQQQLPLPMITLLILPNDEEQFIKVCLKANDVFVKKSRNSNIAKLKEVLAIEYGYVKLNICDYYSDFLTSSTCTVQVLQTFLPCIAKKNNLKQIIQKVLILLFLLAL